LASRIALARFVRRAGVAVEKQDGAGLDPELCEPIAQPRDLGLVERPVDLAVGQHPLRDLEAQRPLDQRHVLAEEQIVGVRPVDAADLVNIAKAFGDDQRGAGAGALQHRIDGDRRAVQEQAGGGVAAAGLLDPGADAVDQPAGGRERLAENQLAGAVVEDRDVGEGAPDIGREPDAGTRRGGTRC
jgi:hypothetical protein